MIQVDGATEISIHSYQLWIY